MSTPPQVLPTQDDPLVAEQSDGVGGRFGRRGIPASTWWTPLRVCVLICLAVFATGVLMRAPCAAAGFESGTTYVAMCYTDIGVLYEGRGLNLDVFPYAERVGSSVVEYPVLQGLLMWLPALLVPNGTDISEGASLYYAITALLLFVLALITVWATIKAARHRPWDAAIVAAAPSVALVGTLNWDFLPVALTALAVLAWSRERPWLAGVLLGLAVGAKLYPLLLLGPLLLLCWRAGRLIYVARTILAALITWVVINLPVALAYPDGWAQFYEFSRGREADFGSTWLGLQLLGIDVVGESLNATAIVTFIVLCALIGALILCAPRRPRFAQVALLTLCAFLIAGKVYSPQFALWLLPFVALARPRWRDVLIWQAGQALYFMGVWLWLNQFADPERALSDRGYALLIVLQFLSQLWICGVVVRDILRPEHDPVRVTAAPSGDAVDDPLGGPLDGAPDAHGFPLTLAAFRPPPEHERDDDAVSSEARIS